MGQVPGGKEVEHALKQCRAAVKFAVKQTNAQAAKMLSKGNYSKAEGFITLARKVADFESEVDALRTHWRQVRQLTFPSKAQEEKSLPLWKYYTPTLKTLVEVGGAASKSALESAMEPRVPVLFPPTEIATKGKCPRWQLMMRRALGAMEKEGLVQRAKNEWRITSSGRKAAEANHKEN